ncbi:hypothetical protein lerEdw1_018129 [Lerista edwardsae]|nr:hypothetical protein lerEdw1_018129 [Lerista edwardsae]
MLKTLKQALFSSGLEMPKWTALPNQVISVFMSKLEPVGSAMCRDGALQLQGSGEFHTLFGLLLLVLRVFLSYAVRTGIKIDMTAPVTCFVQPGAGPFCESTTTVAFYLPPQHQANPPKPSEADIFIETRPAITVYVRVRLFLFLVVLNRSFGGFAKARKNQDEILALAESLRRDGKTFQEKVYYSAGYDSPFKLLNRHNEVWLIKKS